MSGHIPLILMFVCESMCVSQLYVFVVKRWGANNRAASSFRRGKSNTINRTAVPVTCVTFAVTGDRHPRATHSPRISLKLASSRASGLEVLCFLPLGAAGGQMHQAFSGTLARIRPISWTAVKDNQGGIHSDCGNFVLSEKSCGVCFFLFVVPSRLSRTAAKKTAPNASFSQLWLVLCLHFCSRCWVNTAAVSFIFPTTFHLSPSITSSNDVYTSA